MFVTVYTCFLADFGAHVYINSCEDWIVPHMEQILIRENNMSPANYFVH